MASRKNQTRRRGRKSSSSSSSKRRHCKGGRSKRASRTGKKHNKWHQKGCQLGGGSVTGGWPWAPSDVHHTQTAGSAAGTAGVPQAINGNHYSLNTATMAPPQSSNHLVERGQFGGTKKHKKGRGRRHRRFIGEQHGGMAQYLPEVANTGLRGVTQMPASAMNAIQGASTAFRSSDPTIQPIGNAIQLQ